MRSRYCRQVPNAGFEWHGYLRRVVDHYDSLAEQTIFLQGDPLTVSPDIHCLLNQTSAYAPVQVLSWVQQAKRRWSSSRDARPHTSAVAGCGSSR